MAFSYVFTANISMTVGNPTKASEGTNLGKNTSGLKERFVIGHHWNNTGVTNEDGFHKGDMTNPTWFYCKTSGGATASYFCFYLDPRSGGEVRLHLGTTTAAPTAHQGKLVVVGTDTQNSLL